MDEDVREWIRAIQNRIDAVSRRHDALELRIWGVVVAVAFGAGKIVIDMIREGSI